MKRVKVLTMLQEICFLVFISYSVVAVAPSINTPKYSNDLTILIISFLSSVEINKVNPFPALTALFPFIFYQSLSIAFEAKLLANSGKVSLAKEIATFASASFGYFC